MPIAEAIRVMAISVPYLTSTACIKLNERMLLLSIFERIAWLTPDNCPVRLNLGRRRTVYNQFSPQRANETVWRWLHVHRNLSSQNTKLETSSRRIVASLDRDFSQAIHFVRSGARPRVATT
jgi:hypothetical protein